jgi:hypothetical protein
MALPQNSLSNSDRQILDTIKSQNTHLDAQTRVLHTLSDSIMSFKRDQKKDYNSLRNDIKTMQREFFTGNAKGMSDIKKYFEKTKNNRPETSFNKEKDTDKGFFKSAINKLFGPSKYQQKMMDEISMVREISEIQATDIGFIKKQYEEGPRARERELLAQAIASKLDLRGGDSSKGMLGMLGASLIGALGGILGSLGGIITAAIAAGFAILKGLIEALLGKGLPAGIPSAGDDAERGKGKDGGKTVPTPGGPIPSGSSPGPGGSYPRLPGPNVPQLPGPEKAGSSIEDKMRERAQQRAGGVSDAKIKVPGMSGAGKLALGTGILSRLFAGLYSGELNSNENAELEAARKRPPTIDPPAVPQLDKSAGGPDDLTGILQANTEKTVENTEGINGALKSVIEGLINFEHQVEEVAEAFGKGVLETAIPMLDKLGEITLSNGQSINLLPNLGTSTAEVLDQMYQETKDYAKAGMAATSPIINNIVNQMTPTSPVSMPMVAATAVAAGAGLTAISRYRFGKGRIR